MLRLAILLTLVVILLIMCNAPVAWAFLTSTSSRMSELLRPPSYDAVEVHDRRVDNYFKGKYRVGNTTCTVRPIKMAFEVKWSRGKGTTVFFFDNETEKGKFIYASEDKGKGRDRFIFDNHRLTSGKFIRSDGKEFSVKKIR